MDKNVIQALLVVSAGDEELTVRANIIEALRLILKGIEANELRQAHGTRSVATSIGFLAARCYREAARAAEQAITGVALSAVESKAAPGELLRGLKALSSLSRKLEDSRYWRLGTRTHLRSMNSYRCTGDAQASSADGSSWRVLVRVDDLRP